ncbi:hypothetical protein LIER_20348 [Lithospermum erythrorhizon]|uniref:Uncharacterized protein n=1 Tax=Lithospermum erythrorhizon TaxID=34254 RepID=A0AAV3QM90_LITER
MKGGMDNPIPKAWVPLEEAKRPDMPKKKLVLTLFSRSQQALNESHSLVCRSDALDNMPVEGREEEQALRLQVQELMRENERLKIAANVAQKVQELQGENERLKTTLDVAQKEKREAQEQCLKEAENIELLSNSHSRLEAESVGLASKLKNAQMMADVSKRKAEDAAQKLKAAKDTLPGQIAEAIRAIILQRALGERPVKTWLTVCAILPGLTKR